MQILEVLIQRKLSSAGCHAYSKLTNSHTPTFLAPIFDDFAEVYMIILIYLHAKNCPIRTIH